MSDEKLGPSAVRVRSPNYPAFGLKTALEQTDKLFKKVHTHAAPRDVVIAGLGYSTYNGSSAAALSVQLKFGLLMKVGEDYKVSERYLAIFHPRSPAEKEAALRVAAFSPTLFSELSVQFQGLIPDDSLIRSTLIRKGFSASAVGPFIQAFRETMELVGTDTPSIEKAGDVTADPLTKETEAVPVGPMQWSKYVPTKSGPDKADGEREVLHGPLSRMVRYRLIISGDLGSKEIGKLIKILQLQQSILIDDDADAALE